jgi:hypothetical protein
MLFNVFEFQHKHLDWSWPRHESNGLFDDASIRQIVEE